MIVAWITGGAALATGIVGLALYRFDDPAPSAARIEPVISPTGGGVQLHVRF